MKGGRLVKTGLINIVKKISEYGKDINPKKQNRQRPVIPFPPIRLPLAHERNLYFYF